MQFINVVFTTLSIILAVSSLPVSNVKRDVDPNLVPDFGVQPGVNPTGTGDCDGIKNAAGQVVKIPCSCPPDRASFLQAVNANVNAGHAVNNAGISVSFPTGDSKDDKLARVQTLLVTLQNLEGPGVGCPAAASNFVALQKAIQDGADTPAALVAAPSPAAPTSASASGGVDPALVPDLGVKAGQNPTGTGDCDGIKNDAGQVVKIPCSCPPDRDTLIKALSRDVAAGHALNNPSVPVTFPTDGSNASQAARIQAALVTLQNLNGPGVGCPAASNKGILILGPVEGCSILNKCGDKLHTVQSRLLFQDDEYIEWDRPRSDSSAWYGDKPVDMTAVSTRRDSDNRPICSCEFYHRPQSIEELEPKGERLGEV